MKDTASAKPGPSPAVLAPRHRTFSCLSMHLLRCICQNTSWRVHQKAQKWDYSVANVRSRFFRPSARASILSGFEVGVFRVRTAPTQVQYKVSYNQLDRFAEPVRLCLFNDDVL